MREFDVMHEDGGADARRRPLLIIGAIDAVLRAFAARRAWRNRHWKWFVSLTFVSSGGMLPLAYLLFFSRRASGRREDDVPRPALAATIDA